MEKQSVIEDLEFIVGEVLGIDPKNMAATDCIRRLQSSVVDLISLMIVSGKDGEGAPADAGAPVESSDPASPSPG